MTKVGRKGIAYEEVVRACKELEEQNEVISIRKVLAITGGSFSTVIAHVRRWQEAVTILRDVSLPEELISSLKATFNKMLEQERKQHLMEMTRERKNLEETLKQVIELESQCVGLVKEKESHDQDHQNIVAAYEKKLAAAESRVTDSSKREEELNVKLEEFRSKLQAVQIQIAVSETKCGEYEKQLASLQGKEQKSKPEKKKATG